MIAAILTRLSLGGFVTLTPAECAALVGYIDELRSNLILYRCADCGEELDEDGACPHCDDEPATSCHQCGGDTDPEGWCPLCDDPPEIPS